jgi:catechol 2,3-dioxygenase-like lactoylglutathione lyase family enzyme
MIQRFDHMTIVVKDVAEAKRFFGLLGFKEAVSVVISGETFAKYMGVPGIEAEHVTLVAEGVVPRTEIQLLHYLKPEAKEDPQIRPQRGSGFPPQEAGVPCRAGRGDGRALAVVLSGTT